MQVTPVTRYVIHSSQKTTVRTRPSINSYTHNDSQHSELPDLIKYDIYEKKSIQQLLYESAQNREKAGPLWEIFNRELVKCAGSEKYAKHLVKSLDEKKQWAPLHYAMFYNNRFVCDKLTKKSSDNKQFLCDVNIITGNGENILHIAARSSIFWQTSASSANSKSDTIVIDEVKIPTIINDMVERGVDVNHPDDEGRTPLHLAVMYNRLNFVQYLVNKKANVYATTKLNANILHMIFIPTGQKSNDLSAMLNYILTKIQPAPSSSRFKQHQNLAEMHTLDNRTPMVFAVSHTKSTKEIVEQMLRQNSILGILMDKSRTKPSVQQMQQLIAIEQIARRRISKFDHLEPLINACDPRILNQMFHIPCRYNNLPLLEWLCSLNKNLDINIRDHAGYTPLLTAVFYKSIGCVKYLLEQTIDKHSVDITATNSDGENILHIYAKYSVSDDIFNFIWKKAIEFQLHEKTDNNRNTPLHVAAGKKQEKMCKELLNLYQTNNRLLCAKNNQGQTAAHVATEAEADRFKSDQDSTDHKNEKEKEKEDFGLSILQLMGKYQQTDRKEGLLFETDYDKQTCLHLAAAKGRKDIVKYLIEEVGIQVDSIADRRLTPLHLACHYGHSEIVSYLIEHDASPVLRTADLYNSLEIAIMNQHEEVVKTLLTLPNWRTLMRNAQRIEKSEAYDTPMRKLIRYMPDVTVWFIDTNLTRTVGGRGKHVHRKIYDYEFYMDSFRVKEWYAPDVPLYEEKESFTERWHRRGCGAICYTDCCCQCLKNQSEEKKETMLYTDDAYTLVRNNPLIIASEQLTYPALVEHPYHIFLRTYLYKKNLFLWVRLIAFVLYAAFLALWTAIVLLGKHPEYFYNKVGFNMTLDTDLCANVSRTLQMTNDSEALKTSIYKKLKLALYGFLIFFVVENIILILALFPRIFRTIDYILEISAFILTFLYIYDWYDWQEPVIFRCPIQYQLGAMGLLLAWISLLTYVKRSTWFGMGIFVVMIQLIGYKFLRFIPVLLVIICGFGFTHWMLLQNQDVFAHPVEAVIRTGLMMFDLGYEDHLYNDTYYYTLIFVIYILTSIILCIFVLNLLISVAVGEIPSLTVQGQAWQSQVLYDLLSDYSIVTIQIMRFMNLITCGVISRWIYSKQLEPITLIEHNKKGYWYHRLARDVKQNFFDEKIQLDIETVKPVKTDS